jgi:hypothetical protein
VIDLSQNKFENYNVKLNFRSICELKKITRASYLSENIVCVSNDFIFSAHSYIKGKITSSRKYHISEFFNRKRKGQNTSLDIFIHD